jgi:Flp pilus assembly protein TadG
MRRIDDDRGAAGVMIAITMVVLLGMAGLVVDVGAMYQERRVLSNGADAAALAIAEDCALGTASCDTHTAKVTAQQFADANSDDGVSAVDSVTIDHVNKTVTVTLSTLDPEGRITLDPYFAEVVGFDGATVHATATAQWGYPSAVRSFLPLIISDCEFPHGEPVPTPTRILYFHDGNNAEPCNAQAGHDTDGDGFLAGGFGWLDTAGTCESYLLAESWLGDDPGASPSTGCNPSYIASLIGEEVPLPFFDDLYGVGQNGQYHIAGFGLFEISGYNFGGQFKYPKNSPPCSGDARCVSGRFTDGAVYDGEFGGQDRGFVIVKLVG